MDPVDMLGQLRALAAKSSSSAFMKSMSHLMLCTLVADLA
jgi:hypothetical protein